MIPVTTEWNNPTWPVWKSAGSWRMAVGYRELNKVTPPLEAAVSTWERHQSDNEKPEPVMITGVAYSRVVPQCFMKNA